MDQRHLNKTSKSHFELVKQKSILLISSCLLLSSLLITACNNPADKFSETNRAQNEVTVIESTQWTAKETSDEPDVITEVSNISAETIPPEKAPDNKGFYVQIGAFLNENNAIRLQNNLKKKNYNPILIHQNAKGKQWNIVRLGPYSSKASALKAGEEFSTTEKTASIVLHNGRVIKNYSAGKVGTGTSLSITSQTKKPPANKPLLKTSGEDLTTELELPGFETTTETETPLTATANTNKPFSFQIGGLYSTENAKKYLKKYQQKGYSPYLIEIKDKSNNDLWYSIRIGQFSSAQEAIDAAQLFTSKEGLPAQIRPLEY